MKKTPMLLIILLAGVGGFFWYGGNPGFSAVAAETSPILYYTCPMHGFVHKDKPGKCPVCSMDLVPVLKDNSVEATSSAVEPTDGVPNALKGLAPVRLTKFKEQLIGVKVAKVSPGPVTHVIRTTGKFAGGQGDFAALAGDFAARGAASAQTRFLVADIYVLDQPFVKVGQRVWVSALNSASQRREGRIGKIYPDDGTQSRVVRVRVHLKKPVQHEMFANVEIEAVVSAVLAVPREAILHTGAQNYVYLQKSPGEFKAVPVTVGFQGDNLCEIVSGLKQGDEVAWGGNFMIDADAHINGSRE